MGSLASCSRARIISMRSSTVDNKWLFGMHVLSLVCRESRPDEDSPIKASSRCRFVWRSESEAAVMCT
jgi:hypothetical protein